MLFLLSALADTAAESAALSVGISIARRQGLCSRSTQNVSCFRRKRLSAASELRDRNRFRVNVSASTTPGTRFEGKRTGSPSESKTVMRRRGRRRAADRGRLKSWIQRRIDFLRTTALSAGGRLTVPRRSPCRPPRWWRGRRDRRCEARPRRAVSRWQLRSPPRPRRGPGDRASSRRTRSGR